MNKFFSIQFKYPRIIFYILGFKIGHRVKTKYLDYLVRARITTFNEYKRLKKTKTLFEMLNDDLFIVYMMLRYYITKKPSMFHFEFKLVTKCTLDCRDCCHYAPYFKKQMPALTFEEFKKNLDKILQKVDIVYNLGFMGGGCYIES